MFFHSSLYLAEFPISVPVIVLIVIAFFTVGILGTIVLLRVDENRIKKYIAEKMGGRFISKKWKIFGKGWVGEKKDRIFLVQYEDKNGNICEAFVKTSYWGGVYFTEEKIIQQKNPNSNTTQINSSKEDAMIDEIARLREENERLKKGK